MPHPQREVLNVKREPYRDTSFIRNTPPPPRTLLGLYLGSYGGPRGGGLFHMSEVTLQSLATECKH